jgi:hypothetical protein
LIPFIKITLAVPKLIAPAKRLLEKREVNFRDFNNISYAAFESNIDFEIRFMADTKVVGCNWIELPPKKHMWHKSTGTTYFLKALLLNEVLMSKRSISLCVVYGLA